MSNKNFKFLTLKKGNANRPDLEKLSLIEYDVTSGKLILSKDNIDDYCYLKYLLDSLYYQDIVINKIVNVNKCYLCKNNDDNIRYYNNNKFHILDNNTNIKDTLYYFLFNLLIEEI